MANIGAVSEIVGAFTRKFTKLDLFSLLMRHRVPSAPVRDLKKSYTTRMLARRALEWVEHPDLGSIPLPNSPWLWGTDPMPIVPSRRLGEDNHRVYGQWLGLPNDEIETLAAEGVI